MGRAGLGAVSRRHWRCKTESTPGQDVVSIQLRTGDAESNHIGAFQDFQSHSNVLTPTGSLQSKDDTCQSRRWLALGPGCFRPGLEKFWVR